MSFESAASATLLPFASQSGAAVGRRLPAGGLRSAATRVTRGQSWIGARAPPVGKPPILEAVESPWRVLRGHSWCGEGALAEASGHKPPQSMTKNPLKVLLRRLRAFLEGSRAGPPVRRPSFAQSAHRGRIPPVNPVTRSRTLRGSRYSRAVNTGDRRRRHLGEKPDTSRGH